MKQILALVRRLIGRAAKWFLLRVALPCAYRISARKPLQADKAVFVTVRKTVFSDSLQLLYRQCINEEKQVSTHILAYSSSRYPALLYKGLRLMRDIADAKCVFLDDSCEAMGCFRRRKGQQIVQVWHACGAFKKFGWSTARLGFGQSVEEMTSYPSHRNYTLVPVSGPQVVENYREAFAADAGVVRALGVSRTDVFFEPDFVPNSRAVVEEVIPAARGKKILLYAPTFRGRVLEATAPQCFSLQKMQAQFGKDWILLVRQHYLIKKPFIIPPECRDFVFDVSTGLEIDTLLAAADACITDYSSLVFEYSLFGRPMFFYATDLEDYDDWRGFYYDYRSFVPGPIVTTDQELIDQISRAEENFDPNQIEDFRIRFMAACDGQATKRILKKAFS